MGRVPRLPAHSRGFEQVLLPADELDRAGKLCVVFRRRYDHLATLKQLAQGGSKKIGLEIRADKIGTLLTGVLVAACFGDIGYAKGMILGSQLLVQATGQSPSSRDVRRTRLQRLRLGPGCSGDGTQE